MNMFGQDIGLVRSCQLTQNVLHGGMGMSIPMRHSGEAAGFGALHAIMGGYPPSPRQNRT